MSHALAASASPAFDLPVLRELGRSAVQLLKGGLQVAGFAAALWLLAAGPGCLFDGASTVPVQAQAGR